MCIIAFSIFYTIGYPLNNLICGFFYLGLGVAIINAILLIINKTEDVLNTKTIVVILFLLNLGLFFTYYLFIPFVYLAEFIYFIMVNKKKNKKLLTKRLIVFIAITLILPCILGFEFNVLQGMIHQKTSGTMAPTDIMKDIYRNSYSNFILFLPFIVLYFFNRIKKRQIDFNMIFFTTLILYIGFIFVLYKANLISAYYMFKNYYVLWLIMIYITCESIIELSSTKRGEDGTAIYTLIYILIFAVCYLFQNVQITKEIFNSKETVFDVMDIYGMNKTMITQLDKELNEEQLELIKYCYDNLDVNIENTILLAQERQIFWINSIIDQFSNEKDIRYLNRSNVKKIKNQEKDFEYVIELGKQNQLIENATIIYKNSSGTIYKLK